MFYFLPHNFYYNPIIGQWFIRTQYNISFVIACHNPNHDKCQTRSKNDYSRIEIKRFPLAHQFFLKLHTEKYTFFLTLSVLSEEYINLIQQEIFRPQISVVFDGIILSISWRHPLLKERTHQVRISGKFLLIWACDFYYPKRRTISLDLLRCDLKNNVIKNFLHFQRLSKLYMIIYFF